MGAAFRAVRLRRRWRQSDVAARAGVSQLSERVLGMFGSFDGWLVAPEVSFSIYGERGLIDLSAFHPARGSLLVIELKTSIVDVNELVGTLDRKARLAPTIAAERGWRAVSVSRWVGGVSQPYQPAADRGASRGASGCPARRWTGDALMVAGAARHHPRALCLVSHQRPWW